MVRFVDYLSLSLCVYQCGHRTNKKSNINCTLSIFFAVKSADSVDEAIPAGVSNKEELHLLKDAANKDIAMSTSLPGGSNVVKPDEKGDWVLNYTSSATCIRLVAEIKIKVGYIRSKNVSFSHMYFLSYNN